MPNDLRIEKIEQSVAKRVAAIESQVKAMNVAGDLAGLSRQVATLSRRTEDTETSTRGTIAVTKTATFDFADENVAYDYYLLAPPSGNLVVTLPPCDRTTIGRRIVFKRTVSTGNVAVQRAGSDTIEGGANVVLSSQWDLLVVWNPDGGAVWMKE